MMNWHVTVCIYRKAEWLLSLFVAYSFVQQLSKAVIWDCFMSVFNFLVFTPLYEFISWFNSFCSILLFFSTWFASMLQSAYRKYWLFLYEIFICEIFQTWRNAGFLWSNYLLLEGLTCLIPKRVLCNLSSCFRD